MDRFITIAKISDFDREALRTFTILGKRIAIIKKHDGSFYAIEVACKHQGADLTKGKFGNGIAVCPRHQWKYDLKTGECLCHESPPLRRFPVHIENGKIAVAITSEDG